MSQCANCAKLFRGRGLYYCAFCGGPLRFIGQIISGGSLQDDLAAGWKLVMWKAEEEGEINEQRT